MFKKLKDKLAEEVKSSPQRIQQIAQAAQAAVTSASSSISDITNSDLFSIGDNDAQQPRSTKPQLTTNSQQNTFQDVSLVLPLQSSAETVDYSGAPQDILDNQRQRRLSNSSFASDVSFRLPSYETPSMYHLQSDIEISASEAEERGFSSGTVSLDRVTKEQLYAAYRRTQERYTKYRTQYGDLARHYKLLERENAKARSVLVETQDKALRRISELREQCALEQSAKAHLEKALRVEIEEKNMKIETLDTKIKLIQTHSDISSNNDKNDNQCKLSEGEGDVQLINLSNENDNKQINTDSAEILVLNNKLEKTEQLLNKYKESLKASKEKNSQINTELQILTNELENKSNEIEQLKLSTEQLAKADQIIHELRSANEELQNKINVYEFNKNREQSTFEIDYQKAQEEINELQSKIDIFSKREEEYAISLAENKLSIHKELESKESLIRTLRESLDVSKKEIQSLNIVVNDYKKNVTSLEAERTKLMRSISELTSSKPKINELESQIEELSKKCHSLEQSKTKVDEAYKFLQLQMKQETAEKLAMIDRNTYLENRNTQLSEDNAKKSTQISKLENELQKRDNVIKEQVNNSNKEELFEELSIWKDRYSKLESEIQEERDELIKLQSEIEKLLSNHELLQTQNIEFRQHVSDLKEDNAYLREKLVNNNKIKSNCFKLANDIKQVKSLVKLLSNDTKSLQIINNQAFVSLGNQINYTLNNVKQGDSNLIENDLKIQNIILQQEIQTCTLKYETLSKELKSLKDENNTLNLKLSEFQLKKGTLNEEVMRITNDYDRAIKELSLEKESKENLLHKIDELENNFQNLKMAMEFERKQNREIVESANVLKNEKQSFVEKIQTIEIEMNSTSTELNALRDQYQNLQMAIEFERKQNKEAIETTNMLQNQKQSLLEKIKTIEIEMNSTSTELNALRDQYRSKVEEFNVVKLQNECLLGQERTEKIEQVNTLKEEYKTLSLENSSLKSQVETTADSFKNLELEVSNLRKINAEIMSEKDRLNDTLVKFEDDACKITASKYSQTDIIDDKSNYGVLNDFINSAEVKREQNSDLNDDKYISLKTEYDILKEENRRFKSDIEGLQTYLTKISKENSALNDKLRELIANSENSIDNTLVSSDLLDLKKEVQLSKNKVDDLLRENSLLIEENLELKDQIKNQNYPTSDDKRSLNKNESDSWIYKEKYNNLLQVNNTIEKRLKDLEQINKSVDGNASQMQEKNEKLKLMNEKLGRRLDEALVSLRHLHSLQENTELEYLRNILYEYLTGTGMHSVTLAKVLSAIVKFDDMQTKLVLQKEKERQGFLRQLGII